MFIVYFVKFLLFHEFQRQRDKHRQINKFWTNKKYFVCLRGGALRKTKKNYFAERNVCNLENKERVNICRVMMIQV